MKLITYDNFEIGITEEALLVKPIRDLWYADRSKKKDKFMEQMSIIYFLKDPRSNYSYIVDERDRLQEILAQEGLPKNYKISEELKSAIAIYEKLTTTASSQLLNDTKYTIDKVRDVLKGVNFDELEEKDKVNALKTVTGVVGMIPKLVKELREAELAVAQEISETGRARGGQEKTLFEDGF